VLSILNIADNLRAASFNAAPLRTAQSPAPAGIRPLIPGRIEERHPWVGRLPVPRRFDGEPVAITIAGMSAGIGTARDG